MERIRVIAGSGRRDRVQVRPRTIIERAKLSYLADRGWVRQGNRYQGQYRTSRGNWAGEAAPEEGYLNFFIHAPPPEVLSGSHSSCFQHIGDGWFWIHFSKESADPSNGILAIEQIIEESLAGQGGRRVQGNN